MVETKAGFALKDHLFNKEKMAHLAELLTGAYPGFKRAEFVSDVLVAFPQLELKARIVHIREMLKRYLPSDYNKALVIILKALPKELDPTKGDDDFGNFIYAPFNDFVAAYGCTREHLQSSLNAFEQMTKRFSCEDAIRYFILTFETETLRKMHKWSKSSNYHVRRLAAEGSRPLLPWSSHVHLESAEVIAKILDNLWHDKTRYVVRSVANHMNDISKQDPQLVIQTLKRWQKENAKKERQLQTELDYLTRHSLRTLMKQGNGSAMKLLCYSLQHGATVSNLKAKDNKLKMGEPLEFSFDIIANKNVRVLIDYTMYFASKTGKSRSKVYRLTDTCLAAGEVTGLKKRHPLRADMSTIRLYKGNHAIKLQINGVIDKSLDFTIV